MAKIGVLTFHKCINYGSYWQARCLVEGLRAEGHDAELLDHHCECVTRAEIRCALQPRLPERASREERRGYSAKVREFADAMADLPLSARFPLHEPETAEAYDTIVVGSDEVWNLAHPWYGGKPIFYGVGLKTPRLVAYAGSFGSYSCHWGLHDYWADRLKRFDALSVRDCNSLWLVHGSTGVEPELVLDPCLLFQDAARAEPANGGEPYALIYGHSLPDWLAGAAQRWAASEGVRLLSVGYRNGWADEQRISASPQAFAGLMAGARAVVTNFFHGCVFALLNRKPFLTAGSPYRLHKLRDLTGLIGAEHRMVDEATEPAVCEELLTTPPEPKVEARIAEYRQRSKAYLDAALS
jgi:polysaccharide pyruvyl transferase